MNVLVRDNGFQSDEFSASGGVFVPFGEWLEAGAQKRDGDLAIDFPNDQPAWALADHFDKIDLIRINFPDFGDGRGFGLASALRRMGYQGRLRAAGHVINEQYRHARRSGFDEVEIDQAHAARQPEENWPLDTIAIEGYQERFGQVHASRQSGAQKLPLTSGEAA